MTDGGADAGETGVTVPGSDVGTSRPGPPVPLPHRPASDHRPRIVDETGILGLSRVSRSRFGARIFTWFFVFVFTLIVVQMIVALMTY